MNVSNCWRCNFCSDWLVCYVWLSVFVVLFVFVLGWCFWWVLSFDVFMVYFQKMDSIVYSFSSTFSFRLLLDLISFDLYHKFSLTVAELTPFLGIVFISLKIFKKNRKLRKILKKFSTFYVLLYLICFIYPYFSFLQWQILHISIIYIIINVFTI